MATKTAPKAKASTSTAVVSLADEIQRQLATLSKRTAAPTGAAIRITQDKKFKMPDGTLATELDVVIVDFNNRYEYYEGAYDANNITGPVCSAIGTDIDELAPEASSPNKQADDCKSCPQNVFGSSGPAKACKNQRYLAVLPANATKDTPIMTIKVSPTAIGGFDAYVNGVMNTHRVPPFGVITTLSFNPSKTFASLQFSNPVPNPNMNLHFSRQGEAQAILATPPDMTERPVAAPVSRRAAPKRR
jgi:hypothetical protein